MTTESEKTWQSEVSKLETAIANLAKLVTEAPKPDPEARKAMQASLTDLRTELSELKKSTLAGEATATELKALKASIAELAATVTELRSAQPTPKPQPQPTPQPEPSKPAKDAVDPPEVKTPEAKPRRIKAWV